MFLSFSQIKTKLRLIVDRPRTRLVFKALAGAVIIGLVWKAVRSDTFKGLVGTQPQPMEVEVFDSMLRGYDKDKLLWVIRIKRSWSVGNRFYFNLESLHDGYLYDNDGRIVVDRIRADQGEVNSQSKIVILKGNVGANLVVRDELPGNGLRAAGKNGRTITVKADELRYYGSSKRTFLSGKVELMQGTHRIVPNQGVEVDNDKNIAYISHGFTIYVDDMVVTGDEMIINMDDETSDVPGPIKGYRAGTPTSNPDLDPRERNLRKISSRLSADSMRFISKNGEDMVELNGNVEMSQPDKSVSANSATFDRVSDYMTFEGNVRIRANSLKWALDPRRKNQFKNEDIIKAIQQPILITGDKAVFEGGTRRGRVLGNVKIVQSDKTAICQKLELDDSENKIRMTGSVQVQRANNDTLKCNELEIDLTKEEFVAKNSITSEFRLKPKTK
ncbi:hypothetical protein EBR96_00165 [bacterium]|nr:hypothetical protein [bacterium]